ncbi:MAG: hypothetical protein H0U52_14105 [Chloroflexi bacterium]|nr:hypothetical protein [Chloroflexota bacterium]
MVVRIDADRLRAIGSFIGRLAADLVALQEVALVSRGGALVGNAGDLARQLGMEVRYGAVRTFSVTDGDAVSGVGCFGNALLSRVPLRSTRTSRCRPRRRTPMSSRPESIIRRPGFAMPMRPPPSASRAACWWPRLMA